MIVTYGRSSSFANIDFCEQQYFLNYVLGIERTVGKKANLGTCVHKVLEYLARIRKIIQDSDDELVSLNFYDEPIGHVKFNIEDFLRPYELRDLDIIRINGTRINQSNYKHPCDLQPGHIRYGVELLEYIIEKVSQYFASKDNEKWTGADFKNVNNWVWMALDYRGGIFDPRKRKIVSPEQHFDLTIDKPWAKYDYLVGDKRIQGTLSIKGTIDLITELDEDTLEIVDWKTGQRLDWASGETKDYKKLCSDFQLELYHYACSRLFPEYKNILVSIFFIRDGGPFTICFDRDNVDEFENKLAKKFKYIQSVELPRMVDPSQNSFKCQRICSYYKMLAPRGSQNFCKFIHEEIKRTGIDAVSDIYRNPNFSIDFYEAPGE
jgi:hypothetical protein